MQVQAVNFKGIIKISGKESSVLINRDSVESINGEKYLDVKGEDGLLFDFKVKEGTYLNLSSGNRVKIYAPMNDVIDIYNKSKDSDIEIKTKHEPLLLNKLL